MIKQQTIQKKTIENDLKYCINSLSPNLIQLSQSISQIKKLCQSRAKLQLQLLQGDKICIFCQGYNDRLDQQDQNQVKYLKCKKCQQTYHEDCILQTIEHSFQVQKKQIEGTEDYDQLAKLKPTFQIVCLRCDSQDCFSEEINAKKINYIQQLNQICQKVRDQVYDQIVEEKKKLGSCQICNFLWLKRQAEHQIFECDLDKDDEFLQEIKNYEENPQIAKKKIKLSNCKHIFCQNCLSDKVLDKQILQEDYNLCCQAENCKSELTFQEIFVILGSKFNWYMKYKHQKFLIEELSKIKNEIQFVRCRGVYKLAKQNCLGIKLQNRQDIINSIKEIHQLEQQIIYENSNILPDLKAIKSVQFNDQESIQCCNRVYQVIRNKQLDMKAFFEQIVNQTQCENEKKERKNMYDQYLESYIKPFPDHENQPENDCYLITCEDENCQFQFCVNGCLDIHNAINQCPNADRYNDNINIFNIDLNDVVKNFGASTLHFKQVDGSVILTNSVKCFRCFREIQRESKNDENQEQPKCKCFEEYNKIQNNNNQEIHQNYYQQIQIDDQNNLNNNSNTLSASVIDINNCFQDCSKQMSYSTNQKSTVGQNSFRAGKNQSETQEKIKKLRMRSHQSAMRGTNTSSSKKGSQIQNASGNNNFVKLLKMSEEEVKQKSKQAIESIKSKLAINSENDCVLVLKTQPHVYQDEDYLNNLSVYQPNQTNCNFLSRKKNSCILNDSSLPFKPISQNNMMSKTSNQFMNNTHTHGFSGSVEKPAFSMGGVDNNKKSINQNISSLCITPNKSYKGKSYSKQLNRSIDNENGLKFDQRGNRINDENRNNLYKRMQNYNTFMRGKFAFHKLNKQKKELCNISNVLYNSLLENYEVEGMLKSFNPSLQNTQPKKRIYDADDDNENDSPDFNHMKKYYNKKYGLKLQQIENEKIENQTGKNRSFHTNTHTPIKRNKQLKIIRANEISNTSQSNSTNQYEKYYSQSATVNEENKFSKIYTENLLNQSCTDFLNICNLNDFSQMQQEHIQDLDNDNTSSTQNSKKQQNMTSSYNLQNFSQFSSSVINQCQQAKRYISVGNKQKKKNDIDLVPWENDYNTKV